MKPTIFHPQQAPTNYVGKTYSMSEEQFANIYNEVLAQVKCIMAVVNQSAYNAMGKAYYQIKETPLFRHKTKVLFKQAMKAYDDYILRLRHGNCHGQKFFQADILTEEDIKQGRPKVTDEQVFEWWLDIGQNAYKRSAKETEMLRLQIYHTLTYKQVPKYRQQISYVCLASSILSYSTQMFKRLMRELKDTYHFDFARVFPDFSLEPVYNAWSKGAITLCDMPWEEELPQYYANNLTNAYRAFENAVIRDINTAESANEAIIANSELLSPKDYLEYIHNYNEAKQEYLASRS